MSSHIVVSSIRPVGANKIQNGRQDDLRGPKIYIDNFINFTQVGLEIATLFYVHMMGKGHLNHYELYREKIFL